MNGQRPLWEAATAPDGRTYWYNTVTKESSWTKPVEAMNPAEASCPWAEARAPDGRPYWWHKETKESRWEMPEEFRKAMAQSQPQPQQQAPAFVAGPAPVRNNHHHGRHREDFESLPRDGHAPRQITYGDRGDSLRAPVSFTPQQDSVSYNSYEEAEAAFFKLLKRSGVQADWSYRDTMRACIKDEQFRAIKDPKDRYNAWEKYIADLRTQEKEKEKQRLAKLRTDFTNMLRSHPEIKHYTRWKTALPIIEGETIFKSAKDDDERRVLFEDYIVALKKEKEQQDAATRKSALDELVTILKRLDLEPYTRWHEAQERIQSDNQFKNEEKFRALHKSDVLNVFSDHIKALERNFNDTRQKHKQQKARRERKNRDNFIALLNDLKSAGKIKAGTKWMEIEPLIEDDPRYTAILGQPGSTPLDLFWDAVEEEETNLRSKRGIALDVLEDKRYEVTPKTTFEDFLGVMQADRRTANMSQDDLTLVFQRIMEKVNARNEDRHGNRRLVEDLRSAIKHLDPPVTVNDTWEQVRPRIEKLEEYRALDSDDLRRSAFQKHIRRLKEKEADKERSRRDARDTRDRDRERDRERDRGDRYRERDRDYRDRRRRTRTRSPEHDAYEADRRKAQADRERSYRRGSAVPLSPPYGRRDRDERDRYVREGSRQVSSHYDRERREREAERERSYISRADPREKTSALDYGDSRPTSTRKRRDSEGADSSRANAKRPRRGGSRDRTATPRARSKTPAAAPEPPKEDEGLRSGSEEGEIEED